MNIEQTKLLFRLTPDAVNALRADKTLIMNLMDDVIDDFHRIMVTNDELKEKLGDTDPDIHGKYLKKHWQELFDGNFNDTYTESCRAIGMGHHSIGLDQAIFISGYNFIIQRIRKSIYQLDESSDRKSTLFNLVQSALMMDMGLIISEYECSGKDAHAVETAQKFSNDMIDDTISISMAINETAVVSSEMVHAIRKVDENAQRIAAAIEETVASMNSINNSTEEASSTARNTKNLADQGTEVVEQAYQQTEQIANSVLNSVSQVESLAEASQRIGDIVTQIEGIAGQTNLLALNATIEAARAGEAGRGFAVVASEVKSLSTQTAQATVDIKERIQSLLKDMDNIVSAMQTAKEDVEEGQKVMGTVKEQMSSIGTNIDQMNSFMEEITNVLGEQSIAAGEVSSGAANIAAESGNNSKGIMEVIEAMKKVVSLIGKQINALGEHDIPNKVIRIAKSDHVIWKKRLVDMMVGVESLHSDELSDHRSCRLGKWYYGNDSLPYRNNPSFIALEECHRKVHEYGIQAAKDYENQNMESALKQITNVGTASEDVIRNLDNLINSLTAKAS